MAYTDDAVKAKLSALNETQESIVTVAQWIMFHRRYAARTAQLWIQRLKESGSGKRLNLIYLANEVVQQSKARRKEDFLVAFSPMIADATAWSYKGATNEVQGKIRRVIEVWRQRNIFEQPVQDAVEARIDGLDKDRPQTSKRPLGGSLFSSSAASATPQLQPLLSAQIALSKAELAVNPVTATANNDYDSLTDPSNPTPSPPVHAARLNTLLKSLANAEGAVSESIKARKLLLEELEKILKTNQEALINEAKQQQELSKRKAAIGPKKREVEDGIMRGLSAGEASVAAATVSNGDAEISEPPEVEALTPPPVESFTPPHEPPPQVSGFGVGPAVKPAIPPPIADDGVIDAESFMESFVPTTIPTVQSPAPDWQVPTQLKSEEYHPRPFRSGTMGINGHGNGKGASLPGLGGPIKKRKTSHGVGDDEFAALVEGEDGLDDDVKGMLG